MSQTTVTTIGPADHGRRMSLEEFEHAEGQEGHLYELSRGVIVVVDVPRPKHLLFIDAIRKQLSTYRERHEGVIVAIAGGGECKLLIKDLESERHPDLAIYKTPLPEGDYADEIWSHWIPELVIEVVSASSRHRDYNEKPEEYFRLGVREYWIVDPETGTLKVFRRSRGRWAERTIKPPQIYKTPLLPGFEFSIEAVFKAAETARKRD
jgi:Uma2 family endonuclease